MPIGRLFVEGKQSFSNFVFCKDISQTENLNRK